LVAWVPAAKVAQWRADAAATVDEVVAVDESHGGGGARGGRDVVAVDERPPKVHVS
jgi:hypothetical protein